MLVSSATELYRWWRLTEERSEETGKNVRRTLLDLHWSESIAREGRKCIIETKELFTADSKGNKQTGKKGISEIVTRQTIKNPPEKSHITANQLFS